MARVTSLRINPASSRTARYAIRAPRTWPPPWNRSFLSCTRVWFSGVVTPATAAPRRLRLSSWIKPSNAPRSTGSRSLRRLLRGGLLCGGNLGRPFLGSLRCWFHFFDLRHRAGGQLDDQLLGIDHRCHSAGQAEVGDPDAGVHVIQAADVHLDRIGDVGGQALHPESVENLQNVG